MGKVRLDKLLSEAANKSRSVSRELIKAGRVSVDGLVLRSPDEKVDSEATLSLDGAALNGAGRVYIMMNKPAGIISATSDSADKTVLDLLPEELRRGLFPVGRLDKDTTGLIILTNDGNFAHKAAHPKQGVIKRYELYVAEDLSIEDVTALSEGITLADGSVCAPARLELDIADPRHAIIEISEGKYHQVKRMMGARGNAVKSLRRLSIGALELDENLAPGDFRRMSQEEADMVVNKKVTNR